MSKEALAKVVQRAISDASFRRQLSSDTAGALRGFDLSPDEVSALRAGDAGRLSTLGVDQRMSKSFALGGMAAATRMAQSDLTAGSATAFDDGMAGSRTVIPADPENAANADLDGGAGGTSRTVRAGDDYKFAGRQAPEGIGGSGSVAPIEGSPEATADEIAAGGGRSTSSINDDPDGFLAANANADLSGGTARASAINDDPDGFLAANADATGGAAARASAINDDPDGFLSANADADFSGGTTGETAFVDESEAYLTKVGYDPNVATSAVTDAHDRGDSLGSSAVTDAHDRGEVTRVDDDGDSGGTSAGSEHGPNISS